MTGIGVSAVTAYTAHREWASRPPDERYASVHALYEAARARRDRTEERTIETGDVRTQALADDDLTFEASGRAAALTHWSFGQLATIAGAPPNYLRTLPASIATDALNYGLLDADTAADRTLILRAIAQELGPTREAVLDAVATRLDCRRSRPLRRTPWPSSTSRIPDRSGATCRDSRD
jgi:hypothetical protein